MEWVSVRGRVTGQIRVSVTGCSQVRGRFRGILCVRVRSCPYACMCMCMRACVHVCVSETSRDRDMNSDTDTNTTTDIVMVEATDVGRDTYTTTNTTPPRPRMRPRVRIRPRRLPQTGHGHGQGQNQEREQGHEHAHEHKHHEHGQGHGHATDMVTNLVTAIIDGQTRTRPRSQKQPWTLAWQRTRRQTGVKDADTKTHTVKHCHGDGQCQGHGRGYEPGHVYGHGHGYDKGNWNGQGWQGLKGIDTDTDAKKWVEWPMIRRNEKTIFAGDVIRISRGVARVFGAPPPRRPPTPPPPPKKNCNSPKFSKSLKLFTKFGYIKTNYIFSWAIFSSGGPSIFLEDHICFLSMWGHQKRQLTMTFLRNRLKLFYKTIILY